MDEQDNRGNVIEEAAYMRLGLYMSGDIFRSRALRYRRPYTGDEGNVADCNECAVARFTAVHRDAMQSLLQEGDHMIPLHRLQIAQ